MLEATMDFMNWPCRSPQSFLGDSAFSWLN